MDTNLTVPAISVLMPVYNAELFLREAIDSVLQQSFADFEFLIIDDGSIDNSREIVQSYSDKRIVFIQKPQNTGLIDTLNLGIQIAKGKYIARMDADDISMEDRFDIQYRYMEDHRDILVLGTHYKCIGSEMVCDLPVKYEDVKVHSLVNSPVAHPTVFMRRDIFSLHKFVYDKNYETVEDFELWVRILGIGKIENLPDVLLLYRIHGMQVSAAKGDAQQMMADRIRYAQISKLINRQDDELAFVVRILSGRRIDISGPVLNRIKNILSILYGNNLLLKLYDDTAFLQFLRKIWITHVYRMTTYRVNDIGVLLPAKYSKITTMGLIFNLKFILKSFFRR